MAPQPPATSSVDRPISQGYDIALGGFYFRLAPNTDSPFVEGTLEWEGPDPEVVGASTRGTGGQAPSHHQNDFNGGEGLMHAYDVQNQRFDVKRFWDSEDVAVDTSKEADSSVALAHHQDTLHSGTAGDYNSPDQAVMMTYADSSLFFVDDDDQTVNRIDTPLTSSTINAEDPWDGETKGDIRGLTSLGSNVYALLDNGHVHKRDGDTDTWAHWADGSGEWSTDPDAIFAVKERLIVTQDDDLYEVSTTGTITLLSTAGPTTTSGSAWTCVADAGHAILAGNLNGSVYAFAEEQGSLSLKNQTPFEGEEISGIGAHQGVVLVGTRYASPTGDVNRVYEAILGGDYTLRGLRTQGLQLLREWDSGDDELNEAPAFFVGSRDSLYFSLEEDYNDDGSAVVYVWRYDIGTNGLFREWNPNDVNGTRGLVSIENTLFHLGQSAAQLIRQSTDYETDGLLITPLIDFGSREQKAWSKLIVEATFNDTLTNGQSIEVYVSTDPDAIKDPGHSSWSLLDTMSTSSPTTRDVNVLDVDEEISNWPQPSREITFKFVFNEGSSRANSPVLHSYTITAEPEHTFRFPVLASDRIERSGRKTVRVDGLGREIYKTLRDMRDDDDIKLEDLKSGETWWGKVTQVVSQEVGKGKRGGSDKTVAQVKFRGVKAA